jgi:AraC-like DNA-binding protein
MPTPLDNITESHEGVEPRVLTVDVQEILRRVIRPDDEDAGKSVALIALRAGVSTRTVYRVLNPQESKPTMEMRMADKLCLAAGAHLADCRIVTGDGDVLDYQEL